MSNIESINAAIARGLNVLSAPPTMSLSQWAEQHFYLSQESSYTEGSWRAYPFQVAPMDCMSCDDIEEVVWRKSKRVGYTKMLLAYIGYTAHHKKRNQVIWQPTDDDAKSFVKTELDTALRDMPVMNEVFPNYLKRHADNSMNLKKFLGSLLHILGGKAAKNYRRITVDNALFDEIDAFDSDVEGEGSPYKLGSGRTEGSLFPKKIVGSTPKLKGYSIVESREHAADMFVEFYIPCPHCDEYIRIQFGGQDDAFGFKFDRDSFRRASHGVDYLCVHCGALFDQKDYFSVWERGRYQDEYGNYVLSGPEFYTPDGTPMSPPRSIAFHIWAGYSPQVLWEDIVAEFLHAKKKASEGDHAELVTFVNTTLGETWELRGDEPDSHVLHERAEDYKEMTVPAGGLVLFCTIDVQHYGVAIEITAWGRHMERWVVYWGEMYGETAVPGEGVWSELPAFLSQSFEHELGGSLTLAATSLDAGDGNRTEQVYAFVRDNKHLLNNLIAIKGSSVRYRDIYTEPAKVGRKKKKTETAARYGVTSYEVGTDRAKDLISAQIKMPGGGPGRMHWYKGIWHNWFDQIVGEVRIPGPRGGKPEWKPKKGVRHEALDTHVYQVHLAYKHRLNIQPESFWHGIERNLLSDKTKTTEKPARVRKKTRGRRG